MTQEQNPRRYTAYKCSIDGSHTQWDAIHNLTFIEACNYADSYPMNHKGFWYDEKVGKKYIWTMCCTEFYKGDFK